MDRFGTTGELEEKSADSGTATVRAALGKQTGKSNAELEQGRADAAWGDWIRVHKGTPENIATAMRLLTLDLEREFAAEARIEKQSLAIEASK
jgi:hypothetical protein